MARPPATLRGSHRDGKLAQVRESHPPGHHPRSHPDLIKTYAWAQTGISTARSSRTKDPPVLTVGLPGADHQASSKTGYPRPPRLDLQQDRLPTAKRQETSP